MPVADDLETLRPAAPEAVPHRLYEDVLALLVGTAMVALGLVFYTKATLVTGSTAGVALLLHYATGYGFGLVFFLINLPFYYLAWRRLGLRFTLQTFAAVTLLSVFARLTPRWLDVSSISPLYAAIIGGSLMGMGILVLIRHRAGLGGIGILAIYLQETRGLRAGWFQLGVDLVILSASLFVVPRDRVLLSVAGAVALNLIIALNHRSGRYIGMS